MRRSELAIEKLWYILCFYFWKKLFDGDRVEILYTFLYPLSLMQVQRWGASEAKWGEASSQYKSYDIFCVSISEKNYSTYRVEILHTALYPLSLMQVQRWGASEVKWGVASSQYKSYDIFCVFISEKNHPTYRVEILHTTLYPLSLMQVQRWGASEAKWGVASSQYKSYDVFCVAIFRETIVARDLKFWVQIDVYCF